MKTTVKFFALLTVVLTLAACNKDKEVLTTNRIEITYIVADADTPASPVTVSISTEDEHDALLNDFCDYAEEGKVVTFRRNQPETKGSHSKETITYTTDNREDMKAWMTRMENDGKTVTVTYDSNTGMWHGTAYLYIGGTDTSNNLRVSRVVYDHSFDGTGIAGTESHFVYTYFWNGDQLTAVDMMEWSWRQNANGSTSDTTLEHKNATLYYTDGLRSQTAIYNSYGHLLNRYTYTYLNGNLAVEENWSNYSTYTVIYDLNGMPYELIMPNGEHTVASEGNCCWQNGDVIYIVGIDELIHWTFEYDNTLHPQGVTLGTHTLLPGYDNIFLPQTQWSTHNLTHLYFNENLGDRSELYINHTYEGERLITAIIPQYYDGGHVSWVFEYLE